jgi:hypothetical protein
MKLTRHRVRNAISRKSKNLQEIDGQKEILEIVEKQLKDDMTWANFRLVWDIVLFDQVIKIIRPEKDINYVRDLCSDLKNGVTFEESDMRAQNVISILESEMLDGLTFWENYEKDWMVSMDPSTKKISIILTKSPGQITVTQEMIDRKKNYDAEMFHKIMKQVKEESSKKESGESLFKKLKFDPRNK